MVWLRNNVLWFIGAAFALSLVALFLPGVPLKVLALFSVLASGISALFLGRRAKFLEKEMGVKTEGFSALTEGLEDGVLIYDLDFAVLEMNGALEKLLGIRREEFAGKRIQPRTGLVGGELLLVQCLFPSLAPSSTQVSEPGAWPQVVLINTENPPKKLSTSLTRVPNNNTPSYFIKTVRDMSYERETAESKTEFVSIAAHQLRTPLTSINWALESILKDVRENPVSAAKTAEEALRVSEGALKIVNSLLDVAKMEGGDLSYTFGKTEIAAFLREVISLTEPFAKERSVSLFINPIPPEWEGAAANIDRERLGLACENLIENAVKYNTKNGEASVTLEVFPEKGLAKVSVKDTGIGIPERDAGRMFSKFWRGDSAESMEPNGSGLGLYIVKSIIERHGGRIGFESRENRGSVFWFTLPLAGRGGVKEQEIG